MHDLRRAYLYQDVINKQSHVDVGEHMVDAAQLLSASCAQQVAVTTQLLQTALQAAL